MDLFCFVQLTFVFLYPYDKYMNLCFDYKGVQGVKTKK